MSAEKARPISPKEVAEKKLTTIPDAAIEAFNELIARHGGSGGYAIVSQEEVVKLMVSKGLNRAMIFENGWLDVEDIYRKAGWSVEYDKPGYNETYEPTFTFKPARAKSSRRE